MLGYEREEIASKLGISVSTVDSHMESVLRKTGWTRHYLFRELPTEQEVFKRMVEHAATFEPIEAQNSSNETFVKLPEIDQWFLRYIHLPTSEISDALLVSEEKVRYYVRKLLETFKVRNRRELLVRVAQLIDLGDKVLSDLFPDLAEVSKKIKEPIG